jgi:hypothetical protein
MSRRNEALGQVARLTWLRLIMLYMALHKHNAFSRRLPDLVTEELVFVLSQIPGPLLRLTLCGAGPAPKK